MVARCGSLTAAATTLGLTHGAVSRHVKALESWINLRLFDRHARGVVPTTEGRIFFREVEKGFGIIDQAADRWQQQRGRDVVRVSATPTFARYWLLPRLRRLEGEHPELYIDLEAERRFSEPERGEVDLAIRYLHRDRAPEVAVPFLSERLFPVASPEIATEFGEAMPERLLDFPLIHDTDAVKWRAWFERFGLPYRPRPRDRRFEDYPVGVAAADAGLGIALGQSQVFDALAVGMNLARLPLPEIQSPLEYFLVFASGERRPAVKRLAQRLFAEAE